MSYERSTQGVKSTYDLAPGADPTSIQVTWRGVLDARIDETGALVLRMPLGELRESAPVAWHDGPSAREPVTARWAETAGGPDGESTWGFALGPYDPSRPLRIDPDVTYGTYLGGFDYDYANALAVDGAGAVYVAGTTSSPSFGLGGPPGFDQAYDGQRDAFVAKLAPSGQAISYGTYLGGTHSDGVTAIAMDGAGAAYVAGSTSSADFNFGGAPGFDQTHNLGGEDAFVLKLAPNGVSIEYGTYLGGGGIEVASAIAVDGGGSVGIVGRTFSSDFNFGGAPGLDQTLNGGYDGFAVRLASNGRTVTYGTYLGGNAKIGRQASA